jgi:serine/threonine protein kinase
MAPEVHRGTYSDLADVYALGVVMLEVLTGLEPSPVGERDDIVTHLDGACSGAPDSMKPYLDAAWADDCLESWKVVSLLAVDSLEKKIKRPKAAQVLERLKIGCAEALLQGPAEGEQVSAECVVCLGAPSVMAFVPCGHRCLCEACSAVFVQRGQLCPLCRCCPTQVIRVY